MKTRVELKLTVDYEPPEEADSELSQDAFNAKVREQVEELRENIQWHVGNGMLTAPSGELGVGGFSMSNPTITEQS